MPEQYDSQTTNTVALNAAPALTLEGFLRADAAILAVGVGQYWPHELGINNLDPNRTYGVLYTEESVFHPDTRASAELKPVTLRHPPGFVGNQFVNVFNYQRVTVGSLGQNFEREGNRLVGRVAINDLDALDAVEEGIEALSVGNRHRLELASGEYEGVPYEFQTVGPILINHVAVVPKGRFDGTTLIFNEEGKQMPELSPEAEAYLEKVVNAAVVNAVAANAPAPPDTSAPEPVPLPAPVPPPAEPALSPSSPPAAAVTEESVMDGITSKLDGFFNKLSSLLSPPKTGDTPPAETGAMSGAATPSDGVAATPAATPAPAMSEEQLLAVANARFARRMEVYQAVAPLLKDGGAMLNADISNKDILVKALGDSVPDAANKSEDYLLGQANAQVSARTAAAQQRQEIGAAAAAHDAVGMVNSPRPPRGNTVEDAIRRRSWYYANGWRRGLAQKEDE